MAQDFEPYVRQDVDLIALDEALVPLRMPINGYAIHFDISSPAGAILGLQFCGGGDSQALLLRPGMTIPVPGGFDGFYLTSKGAVGAGVATLYIQRTPDIETNFPQRIVLENTDVALRVQGVAGESTAVKVESSGLPFDIVPKIIYPDTAWQLGPVVTADPSVTDPTTRATYLGPTVSHIALRFLDDDGVTNYIVGAESGGYEIWWMMPDGSWSHNPADDLTATSPRGLVTAANSAHLYETFGFAQKVLVRKVSGNSFYCAINKMYRA